MNWKEYENTVYEYFSSRFPDDRIRKNVKLTVRGSESLREREIDILIESENLDESQKKHSKMSSLSAAISDSKNQLISA